MAEVTIYEVGPRDGLQNEKIPLKTNDKIKFINLLSDTGLLFIESGAFVSPKWVPAMADSNLVLSEIDRKNNIMYPVLTPNLKGLEDALKFNSDTACVFATPSESFSKKNTNCSVNEALARAKEVAEEAINKGIKVRGYISTVMFCPYENEIEPTKVAKLSEELIKMGCYEISLGDTIGSGTPLKTKEMIKACKTAVGVNKLAIHFHDTYGQALANILASLEEGATVIDTSVGGLGGCPYAPGAKGNVATEDVLFMLNGMGISTGVNIDNICDASQFVFGKLGRLPSSRVFNALKSKKNRSE
jgi:isopropylmalate/homocitrate/citramalate synthase